MNERAKHFSAEVVDLGNVRFTAELIACIPASLARKCRVVPVFDGGSVLRVAIADPSNLDVLDLLNHHLQRELELCVAEEHQLDDFIARLYGKEGR